MATVFRALLILATVTVGTAPAVAQDDAPPPHVRCTDAATGDLLHELMGHSQTARDLVDRLEGSDLTIYVRYHWFTTALLRGRIGLLASGPMNRVLAIELSSRHTHVEQLVSLAHELHHAVEIANAPSVVDAKTLGALYVQIGDALGEIDGSFETYETRAAAETSRRVRQEIFKSDTPAIMAVDADRP
jgi:hypothetical protein